MMKFYGLSFFSYFFSVVAVATEEIVAIIHVILVVVSFSRKVVLIERREFLCQKIEVVDAVVSDVEMTVFG